MMNLSSEKLRINKLHKIILSFKCSKNKNNKLYKNQKKHIFFDNKKATFYTPNLPFQTKQSTFIFKETFLKTFELYYNSKNPVATFNLQRNSRKSVFNE